MGEKGINYMELINRKEWRRKKPLDTERCKHIDTLYIRVNKNIFLHKYLQKLMH